jgi:hypothetical protein
MSTKNLRNALKARLLAGSVGPTKVWPNVNPTSDPPAKPYMVIATGGVDREGALLIGNQAVKETGLFTVLIVTEQGEGEDAALDYADAVAALFPQGLRISFTGGEITILTPPAIRAGFPDGSDWRTPVVIRYRAEFS